MWTWYSLDHRCVCVCLCVRWRELFGRRWPCAESLFPLWSRWIAEFSGQTCLDTSSVCRPCERWSNSAHWGSIVTSTFSLAAKRALRIYVKDTNGSVFKTLEDTFLNPFTYSCSVFPSSDCLFFPPWGDKFVALRLREDVLFIQCRGEGGEGGWMCIISLEHRVAFHMDFPCALKLFGLRSSLLQTVDTALCLSAGPIVLVWVLFGGLRGLSCCQSACPPDLSRVTRLYHPPVSGILSFLFSSCAEPVFAASR